MQQRWRSRAGLVVALLLLAAAGPARPSVPPPNPIAAENARPGTAAWRIRRYAGHRLEGFAVPPSVQPGEHVRLYVSTVFPRFSVQVFRMGAYGGALARLVWSRHGIPGRPQPPPITDPVTRMVETRWSPTLTVPVGPDWVTGVYLAKLGGPRGEGSYVPFVVREAGRRAPLLYVAALTTWQAYNDWGGRSLYHRRLGRLLLHGERSTVVSFDRPYAQGKGAGDFLRLERPLVTFLEANGYDVAYATSLDLHEDGSLLAGRRALISPGHDEYWSTAMRRHVEAAVAAGTNLAFFGANAMYRHIRLEPSPLGPDRREVNYRRAELDPLTATDPAEATVQWRDQPLDQPEQALLGAMYECNPVHGDLVVYDPLPWLFAGTGLRPGDRIRGALGWEEDRVYPHLPHPEPLWVLFRSPAVCRHRRVVQETVFARFPSGAEVFDAGSNFFVCALGGCRGVPQDARLQRFVRNLLDHDLGLLPASPEPPPRPVLRLPPHHARQQQVPADHRAPGP